MPAFGYYVNAGIANNTTTWSGYDFISFEDGAATSQIMFSVFAIIMMVVAGVLAAIIFSIVRDKKKGKSSCGCGCENCAMKGQCHKEG